MPTTYSPTPPAGDTSSAILAIRNLSVEVAGAGNRVVRNLSLDVHAGETVCVVGESGSGKSVTSLAVMGLLPPGILSISAGSLRVEGEDVATATPRRLREMRATRMAMVFQEPMTALNPVHTVGKQVDEVLRLHRKNMTAAERRAKVLDMFQSVHLPDVERIFDAYPHQLSGGQRQRIVIAMALILEPKLLIADEPTTALDVTTQKQILALIKELQVKHQTAVLFITHDFGVVAEIADRIVVMNRGDLIESGTRNEILAEPKQSYTRRLVSSVPSLVPTRRDAPAGQPVLHVKGLGRTYAGKSSLFSRKTAQNVIAATDVNLTLRKGEILGIVGESGSGKSTVARCIVRLIEPTAGHMMMGGEDLSTLSGSALRPVRRRIQIVFQDPYRSLNPRRTVGESIIEGLLNFGMPRDQALKRAGETLTVVGLSPDAMRRYPHQFSGGQRQRICIARALVMDPEILVADEAVSALDVSVQAQVLELLEQVRQRTGVGVLFITHDLRVAAQICDTIMVMQRGKVVETGSAETVLTEPRHEYTRALIDAAPGRDWDFRNFRPVAAPLAHAPRP
ncbi:ABC transporter ATP-binding protein [Achromobacter pestifer]|uniref:Glutathione import ATP-binding protein GsiA n=1 Tax=Achromobacter pestifer TaxID=1353889 RepID=A0A6S6YWZ9_9BURK|nr:ABC transporter ATP-binding protein [Achromobacter pestifer]CAB3650537.1 Glutathione import ATP-binding protein GsiA [Achromobacter pestifer]